MKSAPQYQNHPTVCNKQNNKYATPSQVILGYQNECSFQGAQTLPVCPSDNSNMMKVSIEY
jgi:hypothetical protein